MDMETAGLIVAAVTIVIFFATMGVIVVEAYRHSRSESSE